MNRKQIAIVRSSVAYNTLLVANYVDWPINSAWGKECEVERVVSNSLMSWKKATVELKVKVETDSPSTANL